jgi:putative ABC transport system permease protein
MTAIGLLVGVGVVAGLMPALRAAKITPIEAMRAE